jgi:UDP-glucose 4-epimerase
MHKKILITGGAGFIGSHIARRCILEGHEVAVIDNLSTGKPANIPDAVRFIEMDISKEEDYEKLAELEFDAVLHLAAQSSGEISDEKPQLDLFVNALGTLLLLKWAKGRGIKRFLYASSMAVYGNPERVPVIETENCHPLSNYGITKLTGENYVQHFFNNGMNTTIFRMFSVYGPGQNMENLKQGMVSIFMAYLLKNEKIIVKGSKDRFRDFIYIDDVVYAWLSVLDNPESFGKIYNLGTGIKTRVEELIAKEISAFGLDPNYPVVYEGTTPADQFGLYADISRIKCDLGWSPKFDLDRGLRIMSAWVKNDVK